MTKKFLLRMDEKLWNDLNRWAKDELRSVNGQIEYLLRQAVQARKRLAQHERHIDGTNEPDKKR